MARDDIDQAAAVPYRWRGGQPEFLLVRTSGHRWIFPKGKLEKGEARWLTAKREAHEEAGVSGHIEQTPLATFLHQKRDLKKRGVELVVETYLLRVDSVYTPGEKHRQPTWFSPEQAKIALAEDRDFTYADQITRIVDVAVAKLADTPDGERTSAVSRPKGKEHVRVFVSYTHSDAAYVADDSLLGFLEGLADEGFIFWHDERLRAADQWEARIRDELDRADVALCLISQSFLTSEYIQTVEVPACLQARRDRGLRIFPIILSPCDWQAHAWIADTQFWPRDGQTIESDYRDKADRDALYLAILQDLREIGKTIRGS